MKKWQLITCSLGVCFVPTLLGTIGYTVAFKTLSLGFSIFPYFPMLLGAFLSYKLYKEYKYLIN